MRKIGEEDDRCACLHGYAVIGCATASSRRTRTASARATTFHFSPFLGYRTSMTFPLMPSVTRTNPRIVIDGNPSYGTSFGVRLREEDLVEVRWARQDSYIHGEE